MIYYTQLIFVIKGQEELFHSFEDKVLPLLKEHNGDLVYRVRPDKESFIEASAKLPYEIHLVTFPDRTDFDGYAKDPRRLEAMELKNKSVEKIILVEGKAL
jgi:hypothetical protein